MAPPPPLPDVAQEDWDDRSTPDILSVNCKQLADALRMAINLDGRPELVVVLNRTNVELMRQLLAAYAPMLMDLDA